MNPRMLAAVGAGVLLLGAIVLVAGGMAWRPRGDAPEPPRAGQASPDAAIAEMPDGDSPDGELPIPPFPPRIADDARYDKCMTMIVDDPEGAQAIATSWQATGGGDEALHCQALAAIATGDPEAGAAMLEKLAHGGTVMGLMRAVLLGQAAEARLMVDQAEPALKDATEALAIAPDDPDLLINRADANDALERSKDAIEDLDKALLLDPSRGDALVLRASVWRRMDVLDKARSDIGQALALDPDDAEALVERGILRQETGDLAGAREDWTHALRVDPTSEAAELAAQNLTLLDTGPARK